MDNETSRPPLSEAEREVLRKEVMTEVEMFKDQVKKSKKIKKSK